MSTLCVLNSRPNRYTGDDTPVIKVYKDNDPDLEVEIKRLRQNKIYFSTLLIYGMAVEPLRKFLTENPIL